MHGDDLDDLMHESMLWLWVIGIAVISLFATYACWGLCGTETVEFELWDAQCPWGRYYTDTGGSILFIDSFIGEGYVLKYFDGLELKTLIVDSQGDNIHVFLHDDSDRAWMLVTRNNWHGITEINIHVPNPKVMI